MACCCNKPWKRSLHGAPRWLVAVTSDSGEWRPAFLRHPWSFSRSGLARIARNRVSTAGSWPCCSCRDPEGCSRPRQFCEQAAQSLGLAQSGLARCRLIPVFSAPWPPDRPVDRAMAGGVRPPAGDCPGALLFRCAGGPVDPGQGKPGGLKFETLIASFSGSAPWFNKGMVRSECSAFYNDLRDERFAVSFACNHRRSAPTPCPAGPWPSRCGLRATR